MTYKDVEHMLKDIRKHAEEMNHEIISADSSVNYTIGFACASCKNCRWYIGLAKLKSTSAAHSLREYFVSLNGRRRLASMLSFSNDNERNLNSLLK